MRWSKRALCPWISGASLMSVHSSSDPTEWLLVMKSWVTDKLCSSHWAQMLSQSAFVTFGWTWAARGSVTHYQRCNAFLKKGIVHEWRTIKRLDVRPLCLNRCALWLISILALKACFTDIWDSSDVITLSGSILYIHRDGLEARGLVQVNGEGV